MPTERMFLPTFPTAPGNNATILLFNTHPKQVGGAGTMFQPSLQGLQQVRIAAIHCRWLLNNQASAANGLRVYALRRDGVNWSEIDLKNDANAPTIGAAAPVQVPVTAAGAEWRETLVVSHCRGVAVEYTAGATGPTDGSGWDGCISVDLDSVAVIR
jgi:hypothetical protein